MSPSSAQSPSSVNAAEDVSVPGTADDKMSVADVVAIRPEHAVPQKPGRPAERLRGRPRRAALAPEASEIEYCKSINVLLDGWVRQDALVRALELPRHDPSAVVWSAIEEIAVESASLRFEIQEATARGRDSAQLHSRRIDALSKIGSIMLMLRKLGHESLSPPTVERIRSVFFDLVFDTLDEALPAESADRARAALKERMPTAEEILGVTGPADRRSCYAAPER